MKILKLIPIKLLVKKMPKVLAYVLTRVLNYVFTKYPHKKDKAITETKEILLAMQATVEAVEDGEITEKEILNCQDKWEAALRF